MTLPKDQLLQEIEQAPNALIEEVLDFLLFTKSRRYSEQDSSLSLKPIWQIAQELGQQIPPEELDRLPTDGSVHHDHYLYSSPKDS